MGRRFWAGLVGAVLWLGWTAGNAGERLVIYTVNYPLQYFAQRIAGDRADVVFPVPRGVDPAFWQPDAAAIGGFQGADLILLNGAGYAKWVSRVSLPLRKLVDTSAGFSDSYLRTEGGTTHSHGREGEHSHAGTAFTTWLDLRQAAEQARAIHDALARRLPELSGEFAANFRDLERDLLDLDARLAAIAARDPGKPLLASHPVYQYSARRYSLNLQSLMWEPDILAPDTDWQALLQMQTGHPANWMLWEDEPSAENRERLQRIAIQSTVLAPCGNRPQNGDFLTVMSNNVANLELVFE